LEIRSAFLLVGFTESDEYCDILMFAIHIIS